MAEGARRFRRYDGGDPLAPPVDLTDALAEIGAEVMAGTSPERAMREYLRRGSRDRTGLDDLSALVHQRRRELLEQHSLGGTLEEVRELLQQAVTAERAQLARDVDLDDTDRAFAEMRLENLPTSPAAAVSELADYPWQSAEARAAYEQIGDLLGREMLDQRFAGMKQALENATDADRAAAGQMMADLNALLQKHQRGEATQQDLEDFLDQHGDFFPERPETIDDLIDQLAARAAAAQRMMRSMSAEQRAELAELSAQAFGSPELSQTLAELDRALQSLRPGEDWDGEARFSGDQGLGLGDGTGALQDLADLDELAEQLSQAYDGAAMDDLDLDALSRQLGDAAAVDARALRELEQALQHSGTLRRDSGGQLQLTPQAMRQLGAALLRDAAARLSGRRGERDVRRAGATGEPSGATRAWEFGDTEPWELPRTVLNGVLRRATEGGGPLLSVADVEVAETEARTQAAVALLVDTSFSMAMDGRWVPMKRTALALHTLIRSRFRGDSLQLVGFGRYARTMEVEELTGLEAEWEKGTNLHHGLLLANRHFRAHPRAQPVLLVVTDGEPTAHLEPDGAVHFAYPPDPVTIAHAVRELDTTRRLGAQTTFFRLGEDPGLARFVDAMAARVDGRVLAPDLDDLGAAVVGSYLGSRAAASGDFADRHNDFFGGRGFWTGT